MSKNKGGFKELFYTSIMPKIYGIGAAVVIMGALFKIQHYPGADIMLILGLTTEAIIFFFSAFEPKHNDPDWSKVYPELAEDYDGSSAIMRRSGEDNGSVTKKLDHMLESSKIGPELIDSLGKGMRSLSDSAIKISTLGGASVATEEYATNVKAASKSLVDMNKSYASTVSAMSEMANASKDAQQYHAQVQKCY